MSVVSSIIMANFGFSLCFAISCFDLSRLNSTTLYLIVLFDKGILPISSEYIFPWKISATLIAEGKIRSSPIVYGLLAFAMRYEILYDASKHFSFEIT